MHQTQNVSLMTNSFLTYLREQLTVVVDIVVFGIICFIALYCDVIFRSSEICVVRSSSQTVRSWPGLTAALLEEDPGLNS